MNNQSVSIKTLDIPKPTVDQLPTAYHNASIRTIDDSKSTKKSISIKELSERKKGIPLEKVDHRPTIICINQLMHRDKTGKMHSSTTRYSQYLNVGDEPYIRRYTLPISDEWTKINLAWINNPYRILLRNEGGKTFNVRPTNAQWNEFLSKHIKVGIPVRYDNGSNTYHIVEFAVIRPFEDLSISPTTDLYILNNIGEVDLSIMAIDS